MDWLMAHICEETGIKPAAQNIPNGVEILHRTNGKSSWLFVLNQSGEKVNVPIDGHGRDLLTDTEIDGSLELEPTGVAVIQMK